MLVLLGVLYGGARHFLIHLEGWFSRKDAQRALRLRNREIAQARVRYGYRKIGVLLSREGWKVGRKRVYRLYREEGSYKLGGMVQAVIEWLVMIELQNLSKYWCCEKARRL